MSIMLTFTWFKDTGKYYTTGTWEIKDEKTPFHKIVDEVRNMLLQGVRPGLHNATWDKNEFDLHVTGDNIDGDGNTDATVYVVPFLIKARSQLVWPEYVPMDRR